ncbi:hypothetical protein [Streptomyces sp. 6-11-2]|uniref:hypothetical protein n=1 Tax=Streptomyces sp. 6-11-2 TaxID=2585753 RepID=UPI0011442687|nr:hypothetical protein [Streptomyces sp. 6-11-2]GED86325.1 hypothetical protein TNCT6_34100 [Streptomyces sp. 6-11-2]
MSVLEWFILSVCVWTAWSVWGVHHLPVWRRGLPALLLVTGVAGVVLVSGYGSHSPAARITKAACVLLVLASWAMSLWGRRSRPVSSATGG